MAEENLSPISAPQPPAVNPLGAATAAHASTLKLKPVIRKPTIGGGLKPGLKLPTQTGLKPGLKLPTQTALRRPTLGAAPAVAPAPAAPAAPAPAAAPAAPAPADSMEQLKSVTQKLKGITQQIPAQAILHKTGIIADQGLTEAQKQASKPRTARISLSDAIGAAPVQNEAMPMKTIRIKRPVDLKPANAAPAPAEPEAAAPAAAEAAPAPAAETLTQRKTLKISRPTAGAVRPTGKFGVKKPGATAAAKPAEGGEVADIADIPDLPAPAAPAAMVAASASNEISDVPVGLAIFDLLLQIAACAGICFLSYLLYTDLQTKWF